MDSKNSPLSERELAQRRPVWEAFSELFVDTDTTKTEEGIVKRLADSPYDIRTLEQILMHEIRPVLVGNIHGSVWMAFHQTWLEEQILRNKRSLIRFAHQFIYPLVWNNFPPREQCQRMFREVERLRKERNSQQK